MGSSHMGDLCLGTGGSGPSKKGKKGKSKQPQRGLGVAQLEKIRLQNQKTGYPPLHSPFNINLNKEKDAISELEFSPAPFSSSITSPSSSLFPLQHNIMIGFEGIERMDIMYQEFSSNPAARSQINLSDAFQPHHFGQKTVTLPLFEQLVEDSMQKKRRYDRHHLTDSISQKSDMSSTQEPNLDLKLSL